MGQLAYLCPMVRANNVGDTMCKSCGEIDCCNPRALDPRLCMDVRLIALVLSSIGHAEEFARPQVIVPLKRSRIPRPGIVLRSVA